MVIEMIGIRRSCTRAAVVLLAGALLIIGLVLAFGPGAFAATGPDGGVVTWNAPVCGAGYVPTDLGHGDYFNTYNAPDHSTCVTVERHSLNWYVSAANGTRLWGYPNMSSGIEWGKYTCYDGRSAYPGHGSQCMRYPVEESADGDPVTSIGHVWPHLAQGDVAYDVWFNKTYVTPAALGQPDGAEVMIWLQHPGIVLRNVLWSVTIGGHRWHVIGWTAAHNGKTWNYLAYVAASPLSSLAPLHLNGVFADAIGHGRLSARWYLTAIDFGEEIARGGNGFAVRDYALSGVL